MVACGGNVEKASRLLGISRTTLHKKLVKIRKQEDK